MPPVVLVPSSGKLSDFHAEPVGVNGTGRDGCRFTAQAGVVTLAGAHGKEDKEDVDLPS